MGYRKNYYGSLTIYHPDFFESEFYLEYKNMFEFDKETVEYGKEIQFRKIQYDFYMEYHRLSELFEGLQRLVQLHIIILDDNYLIHDLDSGIRKQRIIYDFSPLYRRLKYDEVYATTSNVGRNPMFIVGLDNHKLLQNLPLTEVPFEVQLALLHQLDTGIIDMLTNNSQFPILRYFSSNLEKLVGRDPTDAISHEIISENIYRTILKTLTEDEVRKVLLEESDFRVKLLAIEFLPYLSYDGILKLLDNPKDLRIPLYTTIINKYKFSRHQLKEIFDTIPIINLKILIAKIYPIKHIMELFSRLQKDYSDLIKNSKYSSIISNSKSSRLSKVEKEQNLFPTNYEDLDEDYNSYDVENLRFNWIQGFDDILFVFEYRFKQEKRFDLIIDLYSKVCPDKISKNTSKLYYLLEDAYSVGVEIEQFEPLIKLLSKDMTDYIIQNAHPHIVKVIQQIKSND